MVESRHRRSEANMGIYTADLRQAGPGTYDSLMGRAMQTRRRQQWLCRRHSHAPAGCTAMAPLLLLPLYVSLLLMHPRLLQASGPPLPKQVML